MNLVNLSTAMHRLARLTTNDAASQESLRRHNTFVALLAAIRFRLASGEGCDINTGNGQCQALSNIAWSLAVMQCADLSLLGALAALANRCIDSFKPFELSSILWAFAKFDAIDKTVCAYASRLFQAAAKAIAGTLDQFSFPCIAMVTWAFAVVQHRDQAFFHELAAHMTAKANIGKITCQELTNITWAMATVQVVHKGLFDVLAQALLRRLTELKATELQCIAKCLTSLNFVQVEDTVSREDLANLIRAKLAALQDDVVKLETGDDNSQAALEDRSLLLPPLLDVIEQRLDEWSMSKQSLEAYRLDYQRFRTGSGRGAKGEVSSITAAPDEPCYIDLTMLASCRPSEKAPSGEVTLPAAGDTSVAAHGDAFPKYDIASRLPEPLKFLPSSVSPQKLEAYRVGYQCFRAGGSSGARGEVSSTLANSVAK
jgi:hypothetical protein